MYQLVILDRDGVINNDSDAYIKSADEWLPIEGSLSAIAALNQANIPVAIATNQAGIARGLFTLDDLQAMHDKMSGLLAQIDGHIDYLAFCPDHPDSNSPNRKPAPGMLFEGSAALHVGLDQAVFIGDSYKDYQAACRAECDYIQVRTGKGEQTLAAHPELLEDVLVFDNLAAVVAHILGEV